jgi:cysteine desulfurase
MFRRIYLDNSATTPVDPRVVTAMMPYLTEKFGNASSIHHFGQEARAAVDKARHQVAALIGSRPNEILFTSGGTESNNLAIRGILESSIVRKALAGETPHIITSAIEHSAVKNVCEDLEKRGIAEVTYLPVYENGVVQIGDVEAAFRDNTVLTSVMTANNEIGTVQPVEDIGKLVRGLRTSGRKIWFHTDAVQAVGKIPVNVEEFGCDLLSMSAHKLYAPKGIGALYVRRGVRLHPQNIGGHQERDLRGGTEAVPQTVAFGTACEIAAEQMEQDAANAAGMRDRLEHLAGERVAECHFNGDRNARLPNIANISFGSIEGEGLLINLDMQGIAVSTGSACSSGTLEPSPVIRAIGRGDDLARGAIRFSFGRFNTEADLERLMEILPSSIETLRKLNPTQMKKAV